MFTSSAGFPFTAVFLSLIAAGKYALQTARLGKTFYLVCLICAFSSAAASQLIGSEKLFGRYRQFVWQDQHGLPQNGISTIVQTPDGYLWLAIAEGVVRFDGVRFTAFDTGNTPEIKSNNVQSLFVARDGTLWIGTHGGGLTSYQNGIFRNYSIEHGLSDPHIKSLFEDSKENLWIGTDGGGLNLFRNGKFTVYKEANGLPDNYIRAVAEDAAGNLWVGANSGLAKFKDENFNVFTTRDGLAGNNVGALFYDRENRLWVGGANGLSVSSGDGKFTAFGERDNVKSFEIGSIAQDRDGTLFFGTIEGGLYRLLNGRFESATTADGLINDSIQAIFADANGDVWLGTNGGGLAQLRLGKFSVFTRADELPSEMIHAIYEDAAGGVWVGAEDGLCRFKNGKFTIIKTTDGKTLRDVSLIRQDRSGNFWISSNDRGTDSKVLRFHESTSSVEIIPGKSFSKAAAVLPDRNGNVWYGTNYDGLHRIGADGSEKLFSESDGLADEYVTELFEDKEGSIWIGTRDGLSRLKDGKLKTFSAAEGFSAKHVLSFHEDERGNLWIGTHGDGLFRFREEKFNAVTSRNGLYDNLAFQILEDANGNLWMSGNKGIYRANIVELEDFAANRRASVNSFSYGSADGMLSRECNGANPAGARTRDGRLWFPTIKGVVVVDPNKIDSQPPTVAIENVLIDEKNLPVNQAIEMQPAQENLEIQFSATSWNRPQQIRFKYRLEGLDADWVDAGTRRTAYYPHIAAGEYVFRVIADNGEGIWNEEGQTLRVHVLPPFYRTWWFLALCALFAALVIRLIYVYRLAQLEKINAVRTAFTQKLIEYQEQERRRIAVELHDSIGQSLVVIRNRALMSLNAPDKHERMLAQMEEISDSAADSIKEVRQIAHNLHPYQLEHLGLKTALETMIENASATSGIEFSTEIEDVDDTLSKESEINLYRIVQESLTNILKHSGANAAEVKVLKKNGNLNLSISDNGKGFTVGHAAQSGRGLGLAGIGERARMINARYEIFSTEGAGTTINLTLDL